jgi:hypothetical protein
MKALQGASAARTRETEVTVISMSAFVKDDVPTRVWEDIGRRQNPQAYSLLYSDFPLAVIR